MWHYPRECTLYPPHMNFNAYNTYSYSKFLQFSLFYFSAPGPVRNSGISDVPLLIYHVQHYKHAKPGTSLISVELKKGLSIGFKTFKDEVPLLIGIRLMLSLCRI